MHSTPVGSAAAVQQQAPIDCSLYAHTRCSTKQAPVNCILLQSGIPFISLTCASQRTYALAHTTSSTRTTHRLSVSVKLLPRLSFCFTRRSTFKTCDKRLQGAGKASFSISHQAATSPFSCTWRPRSGTRATAASASKLSHAVWLEASLFNTSKCNHV